MSLLRPVAPDDLPLFFAQQRDPESTRMAAVASRERAAFDDHWAEILADGTTTVRTILDEGHVAGHATCFGAPGRRTVGYWIARERWGRGLATKALAALLLEVPERPLHAVAAEHNPASIRVLERCGFARGATTVSDVDGVRVVAFELRA